MVDTPPTEPPGETGGMRAPVINWSHPAWGIPLGLLLVVGDALLVPGDQGLSVGGKLVFCVALALVLVTVAWAWGLRAGPGWFLAAVAAGTIAAAVSGDWFGAEAPPWRDAIVPALDLALVAIAMATWYAGRRQGGELLLVAGVTATGLIVYGQQAPPTWAILVAVAATFVLLMPRVGTPARVTGLVVHALALLGLVQHRPDWFTWTPYPFLSLIPLYVLVMWMREAGPGRRAAWGTGIVMAAGMVALGTSTFLGNVRNDLPYGESLTLLGMGAGFLALLLGLRMLARRSASGAPLRQ